MANANTPFGLRPVSNLDGGPYNAAVRIYSVPDSDTTAIFLGDPVKMVGTSQTINGVVYPDVAQAATGDVMAGVVVGALADTRDSLTYRAASTQRLLLVASPDALFEIQESGGTPLTANDIGQNANFVVAAGNTATGYSGVTLNSGSKAATATLDLQIVGLSPRADNEVGANAKWLVRINRSQFANQVAGV